MNVTPNARVRRHEGCRPNWHEPTDGVTGDATVVSPGVFGQDCRDRWRPVSRFGTAAAWPIVVAMAGIAVFFLLVPLQVWMIERDRLLPAGAVAGWALHPLEDAALSRRAPFPGSSHPAIADVHG
jgi:hypothetical protein